MSSSCVCDTNGENCFNHQGLLFILLVNLKTYICVFVCLLVRKKKAFKASLCFVLMRENLSAAGSVDRLAAGSVFVNFTQDVRIWNHSGVSATFFSVKVLLTSHSAQSTARTFKNHPLNYSLCSIGCFNSREETAGCVH